jgi:SAM-dependent methyltransferase
LRIFRPTGQSKEVIVSRFAEYLLRRYYKPEQHPHPYQVYERKIETHVSPATVILDAGCGRSAPTLAKYRNRGKRLIGVDLVDFRDVPSDITTLQCDLTRIPLPDNSVDLIISQSVFEHLVEPQPVYQEFARIMRPGGIVIFLTANMWDYGTAVARLVPNKYHARIVAAVEGRPEEDTFPTEYKTNTRTDIGNLARGANLEVASLEYLNQYPNYFMFSGILFFFGMLYERLTSAVGFLAPLRGWILCTLRKPS